MFSLAPSPPPLTPEHLASENDPAGLPEDWSVLDTPGHTAGHVSYALDRVDGIVFVGDAAMSST